MIATLGETTGIQALKNIRDKMTNNPEGNEILQYGIHFLLFCTLLLFTNLNYFC